MMKGFLRENWPLLIGGSIGFSLSAYLLQRATGLPLFPDLSAALSYSAMVLGFVGKATLWTGAISLSCLLLYAVSAPLKAMLLRYSFQKRNPQLAKAATQDQPATHSTERPIIYNNPANHLALKVERAKRENLQVLLDSITSGLSDLCYQVTGQREDDVARAVRVLQAGYLELIETMQELERQAKEATRLVPEEPVDTSPLPDKALSALELYLEVTPRPKIKDIRKLIRDNGGEVGRNYKEFTDAMNALIEFTRIRFTGSPAQSAVNHEQEGQSKTVGEQTSPSPAPRRLAQRIIMRRSKRNET